MIELAARPPRIAAGFPTVPLAHLRSRHAEALRRHLELLGHEGEPGDALLQAFFVDLVRRNAAFQPLGLYTARDEERVWLWARLRSYLLGCPHAARSQGGARPPQRARGRAIFEPEGSLGSWLVRLAWQVQIRRMRLEPVRAMVLVDLDGFSLEEAASIEEVSGKEMRTRLLAARQELEPVFGLVRQLVMKRALLPWKA